MTSNKSLRYGKKVWAFEWNETGPILTEVEIIGILPHDSIHRFKYLCKDCDGIHFYRFAADLYEKPEDVKIEDLIYSR